MRPTKKKILLHAIILFAAKGFKETSIRDIASAVGINPASLYFYFPSKEDLLMYMLDDFAENTRTMFHNPDLSDILGRDPTVDGILTCIMPGFRLMEDESYVNVLHVVFQEQHRNDVCREFVIKTITDVESFVEKVFDELRRFRIIRNDADADFWKKTVSSFLYTFPSRTLLGIGQNASGFTGMGTAELLRYAFSTVFKLYAK